ncbi:LPS-assembly protein LptD [Roseomonas sp. KE2513]|uniref:LPS-assembly protein LptD n=1 Tax=Roseomonas sp. KE2513 TaxID=2479202 RepID=UPI0018DF5D93|nr:LPS assembly protein LptD [Roseomonas sp. KE2513]MBI0535638.1 LPS-assembly protein LptD [Roseomonas sp. KE2513]
MNDAAPRKRPGAPPVPRNLPRRARLLGGAAALALLAQPWATRPVAAQPLRQSDFGNTGIVLPGTAGAGGVPQVTAPPPGAAPPAAGLSILRAGGTPVDRDAPVTFTANEVEYDQNENRVTASGAVEAWQGERILRADRFTYDRDTGIATAEGNVQLLEPDGQVIFAERAVLQGGMRDTVVEGLRGLLAQNGRLAANGARRRTTESGAVVSDLSRVVYSSCDLCAENPEAPPLWQLRSRLATQDGEDKRIRFRDATVEFDGIPSFYTPYLSMPDPSTPRASGFLSPSFGQTRYLGAFTEIPYYWAIDEQSDLTVTPIIATQAPPSAFANYRGRYNFGTMTILGSVGQLTGKESSREKGLGGHVFARGLFTIDENWQAGFNINRATSETYLRAYRQPGTGVLSSTIYADGFWGYNAYARISTLSFQSLRTQDVTARIPFVLPNLYYEKVFNRDELGGTLTADASAINVYRDLGAKTRRAGTRLSYELPRYDSLGGQWTFRSQADLVGYNAENVDVPAAALLRGSNEGGQEVNTVRANIRAAVDWRLPLVRSAGAYGQQLIEPRVQVVTGPSTGRQSNIPNEDSLDFEFTDANLFALNRFTGRDRLEGGTRVDAAMRGAWYFPSGGSVEGLVGRSFRASDERVFEARSGLEKRASDWVARATIAPTSWLDLTARTRLDGETLDRRMIDASAGFGLAPIGLNTSRLTFGYLYELPSPLRTEVQQTSPGVYASAPRFIREVYAGASTRIADRWRASAFTRYDLEFNRAVSYGATAAYEDECFIFEGRFYRSLAENPVTARPYPSGTTLILRVSLKTVGEFAGRAL